MQQQVVLQETCRQNIGFTEAADLVGVDVFLQWPEGAPEQLVALLETFTVSSARCAGYYLGWVVNLGVHWDAYTVPSLQLASITKEGAIDTAGMGRWRCRFTAITEQRCITQTDIRTLLAALEKAGVSCIKVESLHSPVLSPSLSGAIRRVQ